jgi:hypothetical protein
MVVWHSELLVFRLYPLSSIQKKHQRTQCFGNWIYTCPKLFPLERGDSNHRTQTGRWAKSDNPVVPSDRSLLFLVFTFIKFATHSEDHCNYSTHKVFSVFTSCCLVVASNCGCSHFSWVPELFWWLQLPASYFSQLELSADSTTTVLPVLPIT